MACFAGESELCLKGSRSPHGVQRVGVKQHHIGKTVGATKFEQPLYQSNLDK